MERGFIIAVPQKYEQLCYKNILKIRLQYKIDLPIEIWQIGEEITSKYKQLFAQISNIVFKNVRDFTDDPNHWKGFQVKAFILKHTELKEPILCDADIIFHSNPLQIFNDKHYLETGTYFFRDLDRWKFHDLRGSCSDKFQSVDFYNMRKQFILSLLPHKSDLFPREWEYLYKPEYPTEPVNEAYQESGVVFINKNKHQDVVDCVYELNKNHNYVYKFIWGDKETFWLACLISNKKYYINDTFGYMSNENKLAHNYHGDLFFTQK